MTSEKRQQIKNQQKELQLLFSAWMNEKKKHEVLTFADKDGNLVEHYPDGSKQVVLHAKQA
ncbi:hypothetical protein [Actinobacillus minor]|uniref:hypothetical protein n=1 Tax=Actinobacillus minor TaxID=51047 RepID=UPI0026F33A23|nr:hypothetical protein [Actinobacillus minor]